MEDDYNKDDIKKSWRFEIDENGVMWTDKELEIKEDQRQHAKMCKSQFDEYIKAGFTRYEALSLIETQIANSGGR